jgi:oligoribonuclease
VFVRLSFFKDFSVIIMKAVFLDIETTGLDLHLHRAIDIAFKIIDVTNKLLSVEYQSIIQQPPSIWQLCDPDSLAINGYTWEQVREGKNSLTIKQEIISLFTEQNIQRGKAVFICQNPAFDRGFFNQLIDVYDQEKLNWPYHWLDFASMYWAQLIQQTSREGISFPSEINLSKNEIALRYGLEIEEPPHRAMKGVNHLILCYQKVLGVDLGI